MPRGDWSDLPGSPSLDWHRRALPWIPPASPGEPPSASALLRWNTADLGLALDPLLSHARWRFSGNTAGRALEESANGIDLEARWLSHTSFWMHFRDAGLSGDLPLVDEPPFTTDRSWIWTHLEAGGKELTHDETRAGAALGLSPGRSSLLCLGLLKEHLRWGNGLLRGVLLRGDAAPAVGQFMLLLDSPPFRYRMTLGELESLLPDSSRLQQAGFGRPKLPWREKWLVAHRLEWSGRRLALGLGELVVLGDRRPGPGYLTPASFLWSEQHFQGDKDNTLIFLDLRWRPPLPGVWLLHADLAIDDYTLKDFGEHYEGQKTASQLGLCLCPLPAGPRGPGGEIRDMYLGSLRIPGISWLTLEHTRSRPYFGTHFQTINQYSHAGRSLGPFEDPNTRATEWEWRHELDFGLPPAGPLGGAAGLMCFTAKGGRLVHGGNEYDPEGLLLRNVGGDLDQPHRDGVDPQPAPFLDGVLDSSDYLSLGLELRLAFERGWGQGANRRRPTASSLGVLNLRLEWSTWKLYRPAEQPADSRERMLEFRLDWARPF